MAYKNTFSNIILNYFTKIYFLEIDLQETFTQTYLGKNNNNFLSADPRGRFLAHINFALLNSNIR